jgi:hypothetical protein
VLIVDPVGPQRFVAAEGNRIAGETGGGRLLDTPTGRQNAGVRVRGPASLASRPGTGCRVRAGRRPGALRRRSKPYEGVLINEASSRSWSRVRASRGGGGRLRRPTTKTSRRALAASTVDAALSNTTGERFASRGREVTRCGRIGRRGRRSGPRLPPSCPTT